MSRNVWVLSILMVLTAASPVHQACIDSIVITSRIKCSALKPHEVLRAERQGNVYYANGIVVDSRLIDRLAAALRAPVSSDLGLLSLGVTQSWLKENAKAALQSPGNGSPTPSQSALFLQKFQDVEVMGRVIHRYYSGLGWTDDYPLVTVDVKFDDGHSVTVKSLGETLI